MSATSSLSICTVIHNETDLLLRNMHLTEYLNPDTDFTWIVADNRPIEKQAVISHQSNILLVPGAQPPEAVPKQIRASYHHALGLNSALKHVTTRFLVFLDPDFFVIQRDWISLVTEHMLKKNLVFFGAPYHPKFYDKYRYFPCAICMFIDLENIPKEQIDFTAEYDLSNIQGREIPIENGYAAKWKKLHAQLPFLKTLARQMDSAALSNAWQGRSRILGSHDTGYKLYRKYIDDKSCRTECLVPVYNIEDDLPDAEKIFSGNAKFLESFLPDALSFVPKKKGYFCGHGFKELGAPDAAGHGWEEYFFNKRPFAFHMHGSMRKRVKHFPIQAQRQLMEQVLRHFCADRPPPAYCEDASSIPLFDF